jgi:hypothetical protein
MRTHSRAPRRKTVWARTLISSSVAAGGIFTVDLLGAFNTAYGATLIGSTAVRIRGVINVSLTTVGAATGDQLRVGARVVDTAETAVVAEGPVNLPFTEWMMFESFAQIGLGQIGNETTGRRIDVRSMRKIENMQDTLRLFAQPNTGTWSFCADLSVLLKLP